MSAQYKKAENLDAKIKKMQLPYFQWKVLFLVSEGVTVEEMSTTLEEKTENIEAALKALSSHGLIETVAEREEMVEEATPQAAEPPAEETEESMEEADADVTAEELAPELEEEEKNEIDLKEMDEDEAAEDEVESLEKLTEEDYKAAFEEKDSQEETEVEEAPQPEPEEKSEVGDFLEGVNEIPETAEKTTAEPAAAAEPETAEPEKDEFISDVSKKTIMVIDDSIVIRKMIEIALEEEEVQIITATSGAEGIEAMEKNEPNLIILDMLLPDMNGIDLLKKIKEAKNTPVIMLSGKDSPQLVENAKEVGVDDFLPKPFRDEELVEKVKNLLA